MDDERGEYEGMATLCSTVGAVFDLLALSTECQTIRNLGLLFLQERVRVVLHCGSPDCTRHGQLNIYEEGRAGNSLNKPSRFIPLHLVHNVQCLNTSHPSPPPVQKVGSPVFRMSMTESQLNQQPGSLWGLMLLLQTGEGVELYAEAREEQQLWIKHLNLLSMFPYSPLPEEPRVCPIKESFRARLNPANFDAGEFVYCASHAFVFETEVKYVTHNYYYYNHTICKCFK